MWTSVKNEMPWVKQESSTETETNCRLYVRQQINGGQIGLTKLTYDTSVDL